MAEGAKEKRKPTDGATAPSARRWKCLIWWPRSAVRCASPSCRTSATFPKATLYRLVQTLTKQGMLTYDPDRKTYFHGHAPGPPGACGLEAIVAGPHRAAASGRAGAGWCGETCIWRSSTAARCFMSTSCNADAPGGDVLQAGKVGPAYCTGVGKAMLAYLAEEQLERALAQQSFYRFTEKHITDETALRDELAEIRKRGFAFDRRRTRTRHHLRRRAHPDRARPPAGRPVGHRARPEA